MEQQAVSLKPVLDPLKLSRMTVSQSLKAIQQSTKYSWEHWIYYVKLNGCMYG